MHGYRNDELMVRWLQYGVFSPINRLHSTKNPFWNKEPWEYDAVKRQVMDHFLRLRHRMIPYLYTMNYRAYKENRPIVLPMYYFTPEEEQAYAKKNQYWFGTDSNGKSLFDSVWFGARNSILIAVIATFLNVAIGLVVGAVWGISKTFDMIMMEIYNIISNIPALLVVIVLTYSLGAGFWNMIFAMTVTGWIGIAYTIRIQIMRYRDLEYNLASRTLGTPTAKIVVKNIMPQLVSVIVTMASQLLPGFISYEAFLSYFGLGLPVTTPSLGRLISDYAQNVTVNAYLFWIPLTTLILVSLSLFIVGQNLADASDPRTHR